MTMVERSSKEITSCICTRNFRLRILIFTGSFEGFGEGRDYCDNTPWKCSFSHTNHINQSSRFNCWRKSVEKLSVGAVAYLQLQEHSGLYCVLTQMIKNGICRISKFFQLYEFKREEATLIWMKESFRH